MFHPQYELRYRGKDPKVKSELEKRKTKSQYVFSQEIEKQSKETQSKEKLSSVQKFYNSVQERPEYNAPPKGVPISFAYGLAPTILDTAWAEGQVLYRQLASTFGFCKKTSIAKPSLQESQAISHRIFCLIKSTPSLLKEVYDTFSFSEMEFIKNVSAQIAQNHFAKMAMSTLNIGPLGFTLLSILASAGVASADSNPIIKRIVKPPALQNLKSTLSNGSYRFIDGVPPNGTDMCANEAAFWNYCEQFYVEQDSSTLLTSMSASASQGKPPADYYNWPCLGTDGMKQHIKNILDDPNLISKIASNAPECIGIGPDSSAFAKVDGLSIPACRRLDDITSSCSIKPQGISLIGQVMITLDVVLGLTIITAGACYFYRRRMLANNPSELQAISKKNNKNVNSGVSDSVITSQSKESKAKVPSVGQRTNI